MQQHPSTVAILNSADALGPVVRARRKSQSLRIDDAAALLGVSVDLMSRLENGQGSVRLDKAMAVLDGLGLALMVLPRSIPGCARHKPRARRAPRTAAMSHELHLWDR